MNRIDELIAILTSAREIDHDEIAKQAVIALSEEYGLSLVSFDAPVRIEQIPVDTPLSWDNRILAIKELREKAGILNLPTGLKEAKEEIDRRMEIAGIRRPESPLRLPHNPW